jgi:DNA-directed RNA polymerase subunit RPC12/RpoP
MAPAAAAVAAWLWFLALGRTRGSVKRLALRLTLLLVAAALIWSAAQKGLLSRASPGFRAALLAAVLAVALGYLYLIRFCGRCGRMVRNLRPAACPRCGALLPVHGMTARLRRLEGAPPPAALVRRHRPPAPRPKDGPPA